MDARDAVRMAKAFIILGVIAWSWWIGVFVSHMR
jgi:hypothetical protein